MISWQHNQRTTPSMEKAAITVCAELSQIGYFRSTISQAGRGREL